MLRRLGLLALQAGTAGLILVGSLVASLITVLLLFGLEAPGVGAGRTRSSWTRAKSRSPNASASSGVSSTNQLP